MKLTLELELDNDTIDLDYRRTILSFFKKSLDLNGGDLKEKYYKNKDSIYKAFSFSVYFNNPQFKKDSIMIENKKMILNFTSYCTKTGLHYFNSFLGMKDVAFKFKDNSYTLKKVVKVKEKEINQDTLLVRTLSPIIVRRHDKERNFDEYFTIKDKEFIDSLKNNIRYSAEKCSLTLTEQDIDSFECIDIDSSKDVKILFYNHKITGNVGKFVLKGDPRVLDLVIKSGLGSRSCSGFGMLEVIG